MGRFGSPSLGYHAEEDDHDIPELNKCPSCGAFFEGDVCPICKTVCPEEMKAGNRVSVRQKAPKAKKGKKGGYRMPPVWYLSTWFIILVLMFSKIAGLILVWMSEWKKWVKITVTVLALGGGYLLMFLSTLLMNHFLYQPVEYVNFDISESEYRERCEEATYIDMMRNPGDFADRYLTFTLTVREIKYLDGYEMFFTGDAVLATDSEGNEFVFYDCRTEGQNVLPGDVVTVFGQFGFAGSEEAFGEYDKYPVIYVAYLEILP